MDAEECVGRIERMDMGGVGRIERMDMVLEESGVG